ncbi:MAG TPA: hypothetical protein VF820_02025 [Patescibacteria group bacterium]
MAAFHKHYLKIVLITLSALAGVIFFAFLSVVIYQNRQVIIDSVNAKPETFTELYFENNENLPQKITTDQNFNFKNPTLALFTFQFSVHNKENKDMTYLYEVFTIIDGKKTLINTGELFIKNNETQTTTEKFSAEKIFPKTEVVVNLINKNQEISFWMEIKTK